MEMTWIEKLIVGAIVAILIVVAVGVVTNGDKFKEVCGAAGGTTVWDGRQWQCIKS